MTTLARSLVAAAAATVAIALATPAVASPTFAGASQHRMHRNGSTWAPTATQGLSLIDATDLGQIPGTTQLKIAVALAMPNLAAAQTYLNELYTPGTPEYDHFLTESQFTQAFGPSNTAVSAVTSYLSSSGFTNISVEPNNLFVTATAPASVVEASFNTIVHGFTQYGGTVYANVVPAYVPSQLSGVVLSVLGLNDAPQHTYIRYRHGKRTRSGLHKHRAQPNGAPPCQEEENGLCILNSYGALGFQTAYDALNVPPATQTAVAVFTEGNVSQVPVDLRTYEADNDLPQVTYAVRQVGMPSSDTSGLDEWDLDTQSSTTIAGNVRKLYLYNTTDLTDTSTTLDFNKFAHDMYAQVGNASFGECEVFAIEDGAMEADDQIFLQAAVQGQTIFSSAGDNGFTCPVAASTGAPGTGLPFMSYPASSPYVMGVGGTTLVTNASDGTYYSEITWIGTGGGISAVENAPPWQNSIFNTESLRTVPDVAMDADPNTGAEIVVDGAAEGVGGTSLASPLSMGTYARLLSSRPTLLGNAGPILYGQYKAWGGGSGANAPQPQPGELWQPIGGFHDILLGSNGGYTALPGYDMTTGMGTFDVGLTLQDYGKP